MAIESINPANGELLRRFEALNETQTRERIGLASDAFRSGKAVPVEHRALWMRKLATLLEQETDELALTITAEMGKPIEASRQEVLKCATVCRFYAEFAVRMLAPEPVQTEASSSYVRWDPLGIVLAVMPWNFPFWQVFRFLAPALMAGNVGLLKHAPNVPQCAIAIESLTRRAGFPRGSFQALLIEARQVEMVLADERVSAVTLTGSEAAGRAVGAQAGWLIKKSVLELGGSDPFLVMASADLRDAVDTAVRARTINSGQSCIAAKRFIVADEIYDEFEVGFVARMRALRVGDPMHSDTKVGPLATPRILECARFAGEGGSSRGGTGSDRRRAHGWRGQLLPPDRAGGRSSKLRRLPRRALRTGGDAVPGEGPRRGDSASERHTLRPGGVRLDSRSGRAAATGSRTRVWVGVSERDGCKRPAASVRRHQAIGLWAGALSRGYARIYKREDRSGRSADTDRSKTRTAA